MEFQVIKDIGKMGSIKDDLTDSLELARKLYVLNGQLIPMVVFDFEYVMRLSDTGKRTGQASFAAVLGDVETVEAKRYVLGAFGHASAITEKLGVTGAPVRAKLMSEIWFSFKPAGTPIEELREFRPSKDPNHKEGVMITIEDAAGESGMIGREIARSMDLETGKLKLDLVVSPFFNEIDTIAQPVSGRTILAPFWDAYRMAKQTLKDDRQHEDLREMVEQAPDLVLEMVMKSMVEKAKERYEEDKKQRNRDENRS